MKCKEVEMESVDVHKHTSDLHSAPPKLLFFSFVFCFASSEESVKYIVSTNTKALFTFQIHFQSFWDYGFLNPCNECQNGTEHKVCILHIKSSLLSSSLPMPLPIQLPALLFGPGEAVLDFLSPRVASDI